MYICMSETDIGADTPTSKLCCASDNSGATATTTAASNADADADAIGSRGCGRNRERERERKQPPFIHHQSLTQIYKNPQAYYP
uniref:Uncharacterized protein n=1 Tax=Syphacia muris TaxID=451379 RepID=A0A0N5AYS5_9BILA